MTTEEILQFVALCIGVLCIVGVVLVVTIGKKKSQTRELVFASACIALSFVLSVFKIKIPFLSGGSVTFASFIPILVYSYVAGARKGFLVGALYGLLQIIEGGAWWLNPWQFICDYFLAFSCIGFAPLFRKVFKNQGVGFIVGSGVAVFMRFVMHVIAGVFWLSADGMIGFGPLVGASALSNLAYMGPEFVITVAVGVLLVATKRFDFLTNQLERAIDKE